MSSCHAEFCDVGTLQAQGAYANELVDADGVFADGPTFGSRGAKWQWLNVDVDCESTGLALGLRFDATSSSEAGLVVSEVWDNSAIQVACSSCSVRKGDLLVEVDGLRGDPANLLQVLEERTPLGVVPLTFVRVPSPEALSHDDWECIFGFPYRGFFFGDEASPVCRPLDAPNVTAPAVVVVKEASGERKPKFTAGDSSGDLQEAVDVDLLQKKATSRSRVASGGGASPSRRSDVSERSHLSSWTRDTGSTFRRSRAASPVRTNFFSKCKTLLGFSSKDKINNGTAQAPLLMHFDVNKTIIHSDSISTKNSEDGVREAVSDIFWGHVFMMDLSGSDSTATSGECVKTQAVWQWSKKPPSLTPPSAAFVPAKATLMTYFKFCKKHTPDKDTFKRCVRSFELADPEAKGQMEEYVAKAMSKLQLPSSMTSDSLLSSALNEVGLKGSQYFIVPTLFYLVATLQRAGREFALLFRSFGNDHEKIKAEWNAFCELRHPIFSRLIEDMGPMDGTGRLPDRRVHTIHTLYRDSQGPILILDTFTNGPKEKSWDSWAKAKPKPTVDTRGGREFIRQVLNADAVEGMGSIQHWMADHLSRQATSAIKDDWAWWQFHHEATDAGKLMPLIDGCSTRQVFFDDNIDLDDPRIVDCRSPNGDAVPRDIALSEGLCLKVNPVEAVMDDDYFFKKLGGQ